MFGKNRGSIARLATAIVIAALVAVRLAWGPPFGEADAASAPPVEWGQHVVTVVDTRRIVPSDGLPPGLEVQPANNNLDAVRHDDGRVYLAFRTAPTHFASDKTVVYVVSSTDEIHWSLEAQFSRGTDLREPRLLSFDHKLFLYVSELGSNALAFEPHAIWMSQKLAGGGWAALEETDRVGYIGWRTRSLGGKPIMVAYSGGEHLYQFDGSPMSVELLTTSDFLHWSPFNREWPALYRGGGSEADFTISDEGDLFGVIRNEAGDATGAGSQVCKGKLTDPSRWSCRGDPRKYDSPLMFWHDREAYLIGRRQVTESGHYDRGSWLPGRFGILWNELHYIWTGKRCSVWRYVQSEDRIAFLLDLPSRGDTCFAAVVPGSAEDELVVYDYSSDINGRDVVWNVGQRQQTFIYRHVLRFAPRDVTALGVLPPSEPAR